MRARRPKGRGGTLGRRGDRCVRGPLEIYPCRLWLVQSPGSQAGHVPRQRHLLVGSATPHRGGRRIQRLFVPVLSKQNLGDLRPQLHGIDG